MTHGETWVHKQECRIGMRLRCCYWAWIFNLAFVSEILVGRCQIFVLFILWLHLHEHHNYLSKSHNAVSMFRQRMLLLKLWCSLAFYALPKRVKQHGHVDLKTLRTMRGVASRTRWHVFRKGGSGFWYCGFVWVGECGCAITKKCMQGMLLQCRAWSGVVEVRS